MDHSDDNRLETLNVRLPDEIVKLLDQLVAKGLFANRSEAIREFVREYVLEERHGQDAGSEKSKGGVRG